MILEILTFPDPRLKQKSVTVKEVTDQHRELAKNMLETMYDAPGIGLAAPQVGELIRLLVIDTRPKDDDGNVLLEEMTELERAVSQPLVIFNPEITVAEGKTTYEEGCLSVPTFYETVNRALYIEAEGLDVNGQPMKIKTDGLLAICLQHEMDHLEGKLFIDRLSMVKSNLIKNKIKKHGYPTAEEARDARAKVLEKRSQKEEDHAF